MPKNRYMQVIAQQIEKARRETKDECWAKTEQIVDVFMLAVTVHLNDCCGLGKDRIMRVNEALNKTLSDFGKCDDKGYFLHDLKRDYKRIMGVPYEDMPGAEMEVEW